MASIEIEDDDALALIGLAIILKKKKCKYSEKETKKVISIGQCKDELIVLSTY